VGKIGCMGVRPRGSGCSCGFFGWGDLVLVLIRRCFCIDQGENGGVLGLVSVLEACYGLGWVDPLPLFGFGLFFGWWVTIM